MAEKNFTVLDLLDLKLGGHDALNLKCIAGRRGLSRVLTIPDINRPGLALSGFFESFAHARVQLFGRGEFSYLTKIEAEGHFDVIHNFFSYEIPCCVFTRSLTPDEAFLSIAERAGCPILQSDL